MKKPTTTILLIALAVSVSLQIWTYFQRVEMTQKAEIASLRAHEAEKQALQYKEKAQEMMKITEKASTELEEKLSFDKNRLKEQAWEIEQLERQLEKCQSK